jgi:2-oxoisovalerate dehydrogenase E1 component
LARGICRVTAVLDNDEYILPMQLKFRSTSRNIPLHRLFSQWQGKANGLGEIVVFILNSRIQNYWNDFAFGPQLGVADGIALANKLKKTEKLLQFLPEKVPHLKEIFMKL